MNDLSPEFFFKRMPYSLNNSEGLVAAIRTAAQQGHYQFNDLRSIAKEIHEPSESVVLEGKLIPIEGHNEHWPFYFAITR